MRLVKAVKIYYGQGNTTNANPILPVDPPADMDTDEGMRRLNEVVNSHFNHCRVEFEMRQNSVKVEGQINEPFNNEQTQSDAQLAEGETATD